MTREEAKEFLIDVSYKLGNMAVEYLTEKDGEKMLEAIKVLEQEPRKERMVGSWIKSRDNYGNNHFTCPFCEHDIATKADTLGDNYCSNCGEKMQEVKDNG